MKRSVTVDYVAVTAAGAVVYTSPDRDLGRRWVKENAKRFSGLELHRKETLVTTTRDYRPRKPAPAKQPRPADDFAIPEYQLAA